MGWSVRLLARALYTPTAPKAPCKGIPMIASMTGFARQEATGPWGALVCELRSVNHRFLEIGFRLPDVLRGLEGDFRRLAQGSLKRGKVDGTFSIRAGAAGEA